MDCFKCFKANVNRNEVDNLDRKDKKKMVFETHIIEKN